MRRLSEWAISGNERLSTDLNHRERTGLASIPLLTEPAKRMFQR